MKGTAVDYKNRLMYLHLLPLMMELEIADILFLIKSPSEHLNIRNFVKFCDNPTCSSSLRHPFAKTRLRENFTSIAFPAFGILYHQYDINFPIATNKSTLRNFFWIQFFDPGNVCSYHYVCPCQKCSKLNAFH